MLGRRRHRGNQKEYQWLSRRCFIPPPVGRHEQVGTEYRLLGSGASTHFDAIWSTLDTQIGATLARPYFYNLPAIEYRIIYRNILSYPASNPVWETQKGYDVILTLWSGDGLKPSSCWSRA